MPADLRSAWLKWARAVEHTGDLTSEVMQWRASSPFRYERIDNADSDKDPELRIEWRLRLREPHPERWSVILGDIANNHRDALDHAFWAMTVDHSGPPRRPTRVSFPIYRSEAAFSRETSDLGGLVATQMWQAVVEAQPYHHEHPHSASLEVLRWLSNVDKHRAVHVVGRESLPGSTAFASGIGLRVLEDWTRNGPASDGDVVARLVIERPTVAQPVNLAPAFTHTETIVICDDPTTEYGALGPVLQVLAEDVLKILLRVSTAAGVAVPERDSLYTGGVALGPQDG